MNKKTIKNLIFWSYLFSLFFLHQIKLFSFSKLITINTGKNLIFWMLASFLGANFFQLAILGEKYLPEFSFQKAFYSALFQLSWLVLALFTITSTSSLFGKGLVMAIGLDLLLVEWQSMVKNQDLSWLFWQIKKEIPFKEQKYFLYLMTGMFGILTLLLISV